MALIPTRLRQGRVSTQSGQALAPAGLGQAPLRALEGVGRAISQDVGGLFAGMQRLEDNRRIMDANTGYAPVRNPYDDPEFALQNIGDGSFIDESGISHKRTAIADLEDKWEQDFDKAVAELDRTHLSGISPRQRQAWLAGVALDKEKARKDVRRKQFGMTQDAERVSFHKQSAALIDGLAEQTMFVPADDMKAVFEGFITETAFYGQHQSELAKQKIVDEGQAAIVEAAELLAQDSIARGDIESAKRGYQIMRDFGEISGPEHKKFVAELPDDIELARAERSLLSGDLPSIQDGLNRLDELESSELTPDQLAQKSKLNRSGMTHLRDTTNTFLSDVILGMSGNDDKALPEKMQLAGQYRKQLDEYEAQFDEVGGMPVTLARSLAATRRRVDKWAGGADKETDPVVMNGVLESLSELTSESTATERLEKLDFLNKRQKDMANEDYQWARDLIDNPLPEEIYFAMNAMRPLMVESGRSVDYSRIMHKWYRANPEASIDEFLEQSLMVIPLTKSKFFGLRDPEAVDVRAVPEIPELTVVNTDAEYEALQSGVEFVDSNGKKWRKP